MRIFIVSTQKFPRGDAGANYIQYLALALIDAGADVTVLGSKSGTQKIETGIYRAIPYSIGPAPKSLERGVYYPKKFYDEIVEKYSINDKDYILCYSSNYNGLKFFSRIVGTKHVFLIRVEDMQPMQYKHGKINLNYIFLQKAIRYACAQCGGTLAISKKICNEDQKRGAKSMVLPILADPYEYDANLDKGKAEPLELIYPGLKVNGLEDDVESVFKALATLSIEEQKKINLNITGTDENKIKAIIGEKLYEQIKGCITVHGFLPYSDLVCLYQKMDFLILPRKHNKITEANFPSKVPELMSYGVIPICTAVGDYTTEYLSSETAIILPDSSVYNCKLALKEAVSMGEKRYNKMRRAARSLIEDRLYYKLWGKKILNFLRDPKEEILV